MCNYCTPDNRGRRKALDVEEFDLRHNVPTIRRNVLKVYRKRNKSKRYFIGVHSKDLSKYGQVMFRNNGFLMERYINFCPMCGRNLAVQVR